MKNRVYVQRPASFGKLMSLALIGATMLIVIVMGMIDTLS